MPDTIMEIEGITKNFAGKNVVEGVSFSLFPGDILGLLGPNGAGKTTIIRMMMDIFKPDAGRIHYSLNGGIDVKNVKGRMGYLPEDRGLVSEVKVLDLIVYIGTLKGLSRQQARELGLEHLKHMGLEEYANKKVQSLSKGMKQKVQFIMTTLHDPDILILDEPLSGLDPVNQELFRDRILEHRNKGKAILLSSHQMNIVEELCDRIYMINHGQEVLYGTVQEIKNRYSNPLANLYLAQGKEIFTAAFPGAEEYRPGWFRLPLNDESVHTFLASLPAEVDIQEMHIEQSSLHQIFINQVRGGVSS